MTASEWLHTEGAGIMTVQSETRIPFLLFYKNFPFLFTVSPPLPFNFTTYLFFFHYPSFFQFHHTFLLPKFFPSPFSSNFHALPEPGSYGTNKVRASLGSMGLLRGCPFRAKTAWRLGCESISFGWKYRFPAKPGQSFLHEARAKGKGLCVKPWRTSLRARVWRRGGIDAEVDTWSDELCSSFARFRVLILRMASGA